MVENSKRALMGLVCSLASGWGLCDPGPYQDLDEVRRAAQSFVTAQAKAFGQETVVQTPAVDPRLRLAACGQSLQTSLPPGNAPLGSTIVAVRCPGPDPWTLHVSVRVQVFGEVQVSARHLRRGTVLGVSDLQPVRRDLAGLWSGYVADPKQAVGMRLKRSLPMGAVLTPAYLESPMLVRRGDQVVIRADLPGMEVRASGTALGSAAAGERLRVRNESSGRIVEAIVTARGEVRTAM